MGPNRNIFCAYLSVLIYLLGSNHPIFVTQCSDVYSTTVTEWLPVQRRGNIVVTGPSERRDIATWMRLAPASSAEQLREGRLPRRTQVGQAHGEMSRELQHLPGVALA